MFIDDCRMDLLYFGLTCIKLAIGYVSNEMEVKYDVKRQLLVSFSA